MNSTASLAEAGTTLPAPAVSVRSGAEGATGRLTEAVPRRFSLEEHARARAIPAAVPPANNGGVNVRQVFFRCVRLISGSALLVGTGWYGTRTFTSVTSDLAYINGEMTVLRAPIEGQLRLESMQSGARIAAGAPLFRIENARFGNQEAMAQLNWLRELTERLQAEVEEAKVRVAQQEQVYRVHEKLHAEKLISRLAFLEEQTKLAVVQAELTNKQVLARQAAVRASEAERQLDLQKEAIVRMPFDGVAWTVVVKDGTQVAAHEPVVQLISQQQIWVDAFFHEKHARKLHRGASVTVRALDGTGVWQGRVESVRSGIGRIAYENFVSGPVGELTRRRVAVRVAMESNNPYDASQFFGVGRSVSVTLNE